MSMKFKAVAAAVGIALSALTFNAIGCSTVIVGKDVSKTGTIIIGHNEDNGGRILNPQYWVPPQDHAEGEMIKFEPAAASIPQVKHTFGFYWSQTFDPNGASFSDGFVNENGVVIVTNACTGIYEDDVMPTKDGGIGYGIRRLMAERATSARHAIDIAIDLLGKYGYFSEGRTYTVADSKEAWQIAIHQGNTWVARRVKDNEVVYIPNNFMMDRVDATDTENVIVAPGMIERAIKNGRYKPAVPGVYNDFNFRVAVAPAERRAAGYNLSRNNLAWKKLIGQDITDPEKFPYSTTKAKKMGVEEVEDLLRTHEPQIGDDLGWYHHQGIGLCRPTTHESGVYVLDKNPLLITGYRTMARPCETPYVPFFPLAAPAKAAAFMSWEKATAEHFKGTPELFSFNPDWQSFRFVELANIVDYNRDAFKDNTKFINGLEKTWMKDAAAAKAQAAALLGFSEEKARAYLHAFNAEAFDKAQYAVGEEARKLMPHEVAVLADTINPKSENTVDVVLYSDAKLDASKIDLSRTHAGVGRSSIGTTGVVSALAKPVKHEVKDMNGDGKKDMVLTFKASEIAQNMIPGATYDIWLYTMDGKKRVAGFDTALIEPDGYKPVKAKSETHDR